MSKNFLPRILIGLAWLAAAVLWLLSEILPDTFGFFNLSWALVIVCGTGGVALVVGGLFARKTGVLKKKDIYVGVFLLVIAAMSVFAALKWGDNYTWPLIAVGLALAMVLSTLATGGKKWDDGDNNKVGYKDYRTRKAEEEAEKEKENKE